MAKQKTIRYSIHSISNAICCIAVKKNHRRITVRFEFTLIWMENVLSNRLCHFKGHDDCTVIKYLHNIAVIIIKLIIIGLKRKRKQWKIVQNIIIYHIEPTVKRVPIARNEWRQKTWLNRIAHRVSISSRFKSLWRKKC